MNIFAGALLLSTFIEGLLSYIFGENKNPKYNNRDYIKYTSLALGVIVANLYKIDILSVTGLMPIHEIVGYCISGLIIGRGSNYLNDFVSVLKK